MSTQLQNAPKGTISNTLLHPTVVERANSALGGWMKGEDFLAQLVISFSDPKVSNCTEESKFAAAHKCVAMALLPSMGHVAIIPRGGEATIMVQWQGMQSLMLRHPEIKDIQAHLVHVTDSYNFDIDNKLITDHRYDPLDSRRKFDKLEDLKGGYLIVKYHDGRTDRHHFVTADTIRKARDCAQTKDVWNKWFQEQAIKTIFRNAYNRRVVPIDPLVAGRVEAAIATEDVMLGNDPSRVQVIQPLPAERISRADHLALQSKAVQQPLDVEQPKTTPVQDATTTTTTKKTKAKDKQAEEPQGEQPKKGKPLPPPVGNHLKDFASAIHAATTSEAIEAAFAKYTAKVTVDADYEACCDLRDWKYEVTGLERPSDESDNGSEAEPGSMF